MASTITLKRRIKTAQNVSKTTKAMQMISASKLKRAQDATLSSRPYVERLTSIAKNLIGKMDRDFYHPYIRKEKNANKTLLLVFSPDKGLSGGLVTNLLREYFKIDSPNLKLVIIGNKAEKNITRIGRDVVAKFPFGTTLPKFDVIYPITKIIDEYFLEKKVDDVQILFTYFDNVFTQKPRVQTILPIELPEEIEKNPPFQLFEPKVTEILPSLLRHYLEMILYQYTLESFVSEQASRMIAMQNATDNAKEIINILTLEYNKVRQEKITNEILDIGSAASNMTNE
ncbi:MAG: ATP synthase F1 subunit gamma [Patescibacteria group bacterium]|nr:ATP synthase F1 subunit gamma [Patescibacteria group bacterium]